MPGAWFYDLIYRRGAPWELGVRPELKELVESGRLAPTSPGSAAIDLGCGTGANTVFLAQAGWDTIGVDFSAVARRKGEERAREAGVDNVRFIDGDLTAASIQGAKGPFDFLLDYGTLDDMRGESRAAMARLMTSIAAPGARCLLWCFYARPDELPWISFSGPSRMVAVIEPGEMEERFGADWEIEELTGMSEQPFTNAFLMRRRP